MANVVERKLKHFKRYRYFGYALAFDYSSAARRLHKLVSRDVTGQRQDVFGKVLTHAECKTLTYTHVRSVPGFINC